MSLDQPEDAIPLSAAQSGMLFETLSDPGNGLYVGLVDGLLPDNVDLAAFRAAWMSVVKRHQALRSILLWEGLPAPVQVIRRDEEPRFHEESVQVDELENRLEAFRNAPVDFTDSPALKIHLLYRDDGGIHFAWICHHALIDDWSVGVVLRDVEAEYLAHCEGRVQERHAAVPLRTFAEWCAGRDDVAAEAFWQRQLEDLTEPSRLDTAGIGDEIPDAGPAKVCAGMLSQDETERLQEAARQLRVTLGALVAVAYGLVLHRMTDRDRVAFGTAATLRPSEIVGIDETVGNFVTTLPAVLTIDPSSTVATLIKTRNAALLDAMQHGHLSLGRIAAVSRVPQSEALFDTILSMERPDSSGPADGSRLFGATRVRDRSHFSLAILVWPGSSLRLHLQYHSHRYADETVGLIRDMLLTALRSIPDHIDSSVLELPLLPQAAERAAEAGLSGGPGPAANEWAHVAFRRQAQRVGDASALATPDRSLTYAELERLSDQFAFALAARGLGPGDRVALLLDRGPLAVVAILAVLKSGCAYVPLDPRAPTERIAAVLKDCEPALILHDKAMPSETWDFPSLALALDQLPIGEPCQLPEVTGDDLAYVIYTSGSTGTPKGVAVTHHNLAYSTAARRAYYEESPEAFLLLSSLVFDSSVAGLFWALTTGGSLVLPPPGAETDIETLAPLMEDAGVTHTLGLPALLELLSDYLPEVSVRSLQVAIAAGEALAGSTLARLHENWPHVRLYNEYGPTEATVWCTVYDATDGPFSGTVPIGRPIPGSHAKLVDSKGRSQPPGLAGELWVAGPGVSAGYLGKENGVGSSFVEVSGDPLRRYYRTGDIVRLGPRGDLEFLGRRDNQVKLRGHRIDLGDVEAALMSHEAIHEAAVVRTGTELKAQLAAFVTLRESATISPSTLRGYAASQLPAYMVPDFFEVVETMPRTVSGKMDRRALQLGDQEHQEAPTLPSTPVETRLSEIWQRILGVEHAVGLHDDFFALGGNSLIAMRLLAAIEDEFKIKVPFSIVGRISTVEHQAAALLSLTAQTPPAARATAPAVIEDPFRGLEENEVASLRNYLTRWPGKAVVAGGLIRVLHRKGRLPPLFWCFNDGMEAKRLARRLGSNQPLYILRSGNLILDVTPENYALVNRRVAMQLLPELLQVQPEGPYYLGGNCQGAGIAMELAQALQGLGKPVGLLIMMEVLPVHAFQGRLALIFGEDSQFNPYRAFHVPDLAWRRLFPEYSVDIIPGSHGQYWRKDLIGNLAAVVEHRLKEAVAETHTHLGAAAYQIEWHKLAVPHRLKAGAIQEVHIKATNTSNQLWPPTRTSGLRIANRWLEAEDQVLVEKDGYVDFEEAWPAGETRTFSLQVTAPLQLGPTSLEVDMVEEGVARFAEKGVAPLRIAVDIYAEGAVTMEQSGEPTNQPGPGGVVSTVARALRNMIKG